MQVEITIYTTRTCPFCFRAKDLLASKGLAFQEIPVDGAPDERARMKELSGGHTVPQIFIAGKPIGGCQELYVLEESGQLNSLLDI
jgi:glutaredoxin 3